jgi:hypothetical protein
MGPHAINGRKYRSPKERRNEIREKLSNDLKNNGVYTNRGTTYVKTRLSELQKRLDENGLNEREAIEYAILKRERMLEHSSDRRVARYVRILRSRDHILSPGAGLRQLKRIKQMKSDLEKGKYRNPWDAIRVQEAIKHLERDLAIHSAWAEIENEVFHPKNIHQLDEEIEKIDKQLDLVR